MPNLKQVILIIFDGWGYREEKEHNAIAAARKPFFDYLWQTYPHALLDASGEAVGLPEGVMGGSEVGHMTMGAGRVIDTDLVRISKAFKNGEAQNSPAFQKLFAHVKKYNSVLHVKGLLSPIGVHAHQEHLHDFLRRAKEAGISKIAIHAFTDGRDTPPQSAHLFLSNLENLISELGIGRIATASGRYYAMDRDQNWDRVQKVEKAIFEGIGQAYQGEKPSQVIQKLHQQGMMDEHLEPIIFLDENGENFKISRNDGVFFFNFRADRARMLSQRVIARAGGLNLCFVTMTEYDKNFDCLVAFPPERTETSLAAEISAAGLSQSHIAETDKYAHLTFFFNCGREQPHNNEKFILIDTRKDVRTHDQAPEMRAARIADAAVKEINSGVNFVAINFANPDMVGHTGNFSATVKAVETVDQELKRVVETALNNQAAVLITADHGNAEINFDEKNQQRHTAHTTSRVPAILIVNDEQLHSGTLADIAPTILKLLEIKKPASMTGEALF